MKKKSNCNSLISKKEKKELYTLIGNVDWCDEDSIFDLGIELGRYSVFLRSKVLESKEEL